MKDKIKQIMKETFEIQDVPDDISRKGTAEWDSLKHLILISNLEAEFNVSIEPEDITEMNSISDIEAVMIRLLKS